MRQEFVLDGVHGLVGLLETHRFYLLKRPYLLFVFATIRVFCSLAYTYLDRLDLRCRIVTGNCSSGSVVGLVDAGSVYEQRMEEHRVARLHLQVHPFNCRRQFLNGRDQRS